MMKRIAALFLAGILLAVFALPAFAAEDIPPPADDAPEAIVLDDEPEPEAETGDIVVTDETGEIEETDEIDEAGETDETDETLTGEETKATATTQVPLDFPQPDSLHDPASISFTGGDGSISNPYQISDAAQLDAVRQDLSAHYVLNNDIDLAGWNWTPIGNEMDSDPDRGYWKNSFTGTFDGRGYAINNLTIEADNAMQNVGLFAGTSGASEIRNLTLNNASILVHIYLNERITSNIFNVGALVGDANGLLIERCTVDANSSVTVLVQQTPTGTQSPNVARVDLGGLIGIGYGDYSYLTNHATVGAYYVDLTEKVVDCNVGGIVGYEWGSTAGSTLYRCVNTGAITAESNHAEVGGIAGLMYGGRLEECSNTGAITANGVYSLSSTQSAGGLTGRSGSIEFLHCYSTGAVTVAANTVAHSSRIYAADAYAGGLAGGNLRSFTTEQATFTNCYFAGTVSTTANAPTALISLGHGAFSAADEAQIHNSYYRNTTDRPTNAGTGGEAVSAAQLQDPDMVAKLNTLNGAALVPPVWQVDEAGENRGYPVFAVPDNNTYSNLTFPVARKNVLKGEEFATSLPTIQVNGIKTTLTGSEYGFVWSSSIPEVASIAADGTITARNNGTTLITATYRGLTASYAVIVSASGTQDMYVIARNGLTLESMPGGTGGTIHVPRGGRVAILSPSYTLVESERWAFVSYNGDGGWAKLSLLLDGDEFAAYDEAYLATIAAQLGQRVPGYNLNGTWPYMYKSSGTLEQCVWYARGRFAHIHNITPGTQFSLGTNANTLMAAARRDTTYGLKTLSLDDAIATRTIIPQSMLAVIGEGNASSAARIYGHVFVVEAYDPINNLVYYSHHVAGTENVSAFGARNQRGTIQCVDTEVFWRYLQDSSKYYDAANPSTCGFIYL